MNRSFCKIFNCAIFFFAAFTPLLAQSNSTTAWHNGKFQVDVAGVLGRSSIILESRISRLNRRFRWEMASSVSQFGQKTA